MSLLTKLHCQRCRQYCKTLHNKGENIYHIYRFEGHLDILSMDIKETLYKIFSPVRGKLFTRLQTQWYTTGFGKHNVYLFTHCRRSQQRVLFDKYHLTEKTIIINYLITFLVKQSVYKLNFPVNQSL